MAKSSNVVKKFLQEFYAILPDLTNYELEVVSGCAGREMTRRDNLCDNQNLTWSEALDRISVMANAESSRYDLDETSLRAFLEARMPKGVVNSFLQRLDDVSNESSDGVMTDSTLSRFYDRAINLKKKYPRKRKCG